MESPYGKILDEIPADFVHPELWPEYGALYRPVGICAREEVGTSPKGIRWSLWPVTFEEYVTDETPVLADADQGALARSRLVAWKRFRRSDVPPGWKLFSKRPWELDGIFRLRPGEDYTKEWQRSGQRDLKRWRRNTGRYAIEEIGFDEYKKAYKKGTVRRKIGMEHLRSMERAVAGLPHAKENLHLWVVRNKNTGAVVAGLGAIYSHANHASMYHIPFVLKEGKELYAMTGLMDHWFADAQKNGIRMQVFTNFWQPGEARDWKGSSEFKSRFITSLVAYPPTLWQFRRGKIF